MVEEKIDGAFEFRGGRQIRCFDLRRKREAVVTRCPRNTCTLDGEDGNTCPSSREVDLRGGEVNRVKGLGFSSSWARGFGPIEKRVCPFGSVGLLYVRNLVLGLARFF